MKESGTGITGYRSYCAGAGAFALGDGGASCTGSLAAAAVAAGGGGIGSGQIGSVVPAFAVAGWAGVCGEEAPAAVLRARRAAGALACCGFVLVALAAATPGKAEPVGSGFIMLTGGIEAGVGKSMLAIL